MSIKSQLLSNIYFSKSPLLVQVFHRYSPLSKLNQVRDCFINESAKLLFIHNPKAAGTSVKEKLGLSAKDKLHHTPSFLVSKLEWESYYTIVSVRHPIDRLKSSYHYHTQKKYKGHYFKKYPNIHQLSLPEYFDLFRKEPFAIRPQVDYLTHQLSKKPVDFVIRFEALHADMEQLSQQVPIKPNQLAHYNASDKDQKLDHYFEDFNFRNKVLKYYRKDFEQLGYEPGFIQLGQLNVT